MSLKLFNESSKRPEKLTFVQAVQKWSEKFATEEEKKNNDQEEIEISNAEINCILNIKTRDKRKENGAYKFN